MKNLFTGAWIFAVGSLVLYAIFKFLAHPLVMSIEETVEEKSTTAEVYIISVLVSALLVFIFFILGCLMYKTGESFNRNKKRKRR